MENQTQATQGPVDTDARRHQTARLEHQQLGETIDENESRIRQTIERSKEKLTQTDSSRLAGPR